MSSSAPSSAASTGSTAPSRPYMRFVKAEADRWTTARDNLATLREETAAFLEKLTR